MIQSAFEYYIRRFIHLDLLSCYGAINFYKLNTDSKYHHVFITSKRNYIGLFNSGLPQFWTIKLYEVADTYQTICMV